ncbi:helix-turn-helix domain-containing protein [uncultured Kordia sp.]|uniref:helix-turn-helix domain-containing protein n=1 Tax=uncultured Kordia sp. TaxID=507699 RepID=UPI002631292C|nr:helix-turn-helix domain-containing protein [uncultured Kordia sp.]
MTLSIIKYRILRITIAIAMLFCLWNCNKEKTSLKIANEDKKQLSVIGNMINEDIERADLLIEELLQKAETNNDLLLKANVYLKRGVLLTKKGEFINARDTLISGVNMIKDIKDLPLKNLFLLRIGNVYALDDESDIAMNYYTKVYEDASTKNNKKEIFLAHANMAKIMRNAKRFDEALAIYKQSYKQRKLLNIQPKNVARVLMGIGGTFLKMQEPDSALYYSRKGFKLSESINDKSGKSFFQHDFGVAYYLKKDYSRALQHLDTAKTYITYLKNDERLSETLFNIGRCYYKLQEYDTAIDQFNQVNTIIKQAEKLNSKGFDPIYLEDMYDLLSKCYLAKQDVVKSTMYETKRDQISRVKNKENNEIARAMHESDFNINNEFIQTVLAANKQTLSRYQGILIIIGIICLASIYFLFHYKNEAKKNKEIFEKLVQSQEKKEKENQERSKPKEIVITDSKVEAVLKRLEKLEEQNYFLESSCSLANMAKKTKTNTTYLTQILKQYKEKTFYQYLNELRINYTIDRLNTDHQFRKYAIKHIALEVGYKSPESFTKHFKKAAGINPSYYIKELEKRLENKV